MEQPILKSTKVIIVGGSTGRDLATTYANTDWNIWCVAKIYPLVPYASLVFELHQNSERWDAGTYKAQKDNKLITSANFSNSYILPTEEILKEFDGELSSSFSWITAYAILRGVTDIMLLGINMMHNSEILTQRPGLFYLLGYARARGIQITVPPTSRLRTDIIFN